MVFDFCNLEAILEWFSGSTRRHTQETEMKRTANAHFRGSRVRSVCVCCAFGVRLTRSCSRTFFSLLPINRRRMTRLLTKLTTKLATKLTTKLVTKLVTEL